LPLARLSKSEYRVEIARNFFLIMGVSNHRHQPFRSPSASSSKIGLCCNSFLPSHKPIILLGLAFTRISNNFQKTGGNATDFIAGGPFLLWCHEHEPHETAINDSYSLLEDNKAQGMCQQDF